MSDRLADLELSKALVNILISQVYKKLLKDVDKAKIVVKNAKTRPRQKVSQKSGRKKRTSIQEKSRSNRNKNLEGRESRKKSRSNRN